MLPVAIVEGVDLGLPELEKRVRARPRPAEPPVGKAAPAVNGDARKVEFIRDGAGDAGG